MIKSGSKNIRILDLGCGKGEVSRYISEENSVYGLDISKIALKEGKAVYGRCCCGRCRKAAF
ncbi:hypothetical protein DRN80_02845 [Methanosarcinales archaeon]|nr:class I SAM-dependent methyltransferase [Methanophagales archaeon]RLG34813.1 MAG: hypothetical protein DRN80_02845 [Methanosarcinales archaeon]